MKKILAILVILTMFVGFTFAEEGTGIKPSVDAWAKLTWGIDLGSGTDKKTTAKPKHGFENAFYVYFGLPLYKGDLGQKGEGNVSVQFSLAGSGGLETEASHANDSVTKSGIASYGKIKNWGAQLNFFGAYMTVYAEPSFVTSYAKQWVPLTAPFWWGSNDGAKGVLTGYGTKLGYANDNIADSNFGLDVGLKFASNGSWGTSGSSSSTITESWVEVDTAVVTEAPVTGKYYEKVVEGLDANGNEIAVYKEVGDETATVAWAHSYGTSKLAYYRSKTTTTTTVSAVNSKYSMGFDIGLTYDKYVYFNSSVDFSFNPADEYNNQDSINPIDISKKYLAFGFKVGSKAVEGLDVSIATDLVTHVPDANDPTKEAVAVDLAFNASYKWVWLGLFYGNDASEFNTINKDGKIVGDLALGIGFESNGDFLEGLNFGVKLSFNSLLGHLTDAQKKLGLTVPMGMKVWASYKATVTDEVWIKPYFNLWGETNNMDYADKTAPAKQKFRFAVVYQIGVTVSPMEKVEIDLNWKHGKTEHKYGGMGPSAGGKDSTISAPAQNKAHNGLFRMSLKLIY